MGIQLSTQTALCPEADLTNIAVALTAQLRDVARAWRVDPLTVSTHSHPSWYPFTIVDDIPEAPGALAYHDIDPTGKPYGRIGAKGCIHSGISISSAISHEAVELLGDTYCATWAYSTRLNALIAQELCDPVQDGTYDIGTIEVSNYVLPAYFEDEADGPYDHLGELSQPFSIARGGYQIKMTAGRVTQVFGDRFDPILREAKAASHGRTYWREVQAAAQD